VCRLTAGVILCEIFDLLYNADEKGQFWKIIQRDERENPLSNFRLLLSSFPENNKLSKLMENQSLEAVCQVGW